MRRGAVAGVIAATLLLAGCSAADDTALVDRAGSDFDALVSVASATDVAVLRTLEVEEPSVESCDPENENARYTVFVATGAFAIGSEAADRTQVLSSFEPSFAAVGDESPRWGSVEGLPADQQAWVGVEGITASMTIDDGLLVIAVFSPCR